LNEILQFLEGEEKILDLYSGVGNITLPLAMEAKEVVGIEENPSAIKDAIFNSEKNCIKNCEWIQGSVEDMLGRLRKRRFDLITLDPPRAGCRNVLEQIVEFGAKKIVYISCEPTTFSRDIGILIKNHYSLKALTLIDMFPQTYHMEVIALLNRV
jgi:23S rRNA (uracil1939-C5)-methyltransferase